MKAFNKLVLFSLTLFFLSSTYAAINLYQQWKNGLKGARLVAYSGSVINYNSTLTRINFCHDGQSYSYFREGSWSVPGMAGGTSNSKITGKWDIQMNNFGVMLTYVTDQGQSGFFPIYLQSNGKVNIGGTAYTVQTGAADC
jgi:hypothetical protein